jgi:hypothetical protein
MMADFVRSVIRLQWSLQIPPPPKWMGASFLTARFQTLAFEGPYITQAEFSEVGQGIDVVALPFSTPVGAM